MAVISLPVPADRFRFKEKSLAENLLGRSQALQRRNYTGLVIGVGGVDTAACRFPLAFPNKRTLLAGVEVNGILHISGYLT
jgi:hypothetical protein